MAEYINSQFDETGKTHVSGSWWKDNEDNYYCVFNDGTYSIGDYSLYVSSQPTKQEYGRYKKQYQDLGKTSAYTDNGVIYYVNSEGEEIGNESYKEDPNYQLAIEANKEAFENMSETQTNMCKNFQNVINMLDAKFNYNRPVYSAYLYFNVGNLVVNTASKEWNQNILISFNHKQNGSGQANTFELQIMFKLNERDMSFQINELESALLTVTSVVKDENYKELKSKKDLCGGCIYCYGYGDHDGLRTPMYQGNVLKYTSQINNGILTYTITGVASLYASKEDRLSSKPEYYQLNGIDITTVTDPNSKSKSYNVGDTTEDGKTVVSDDLVGSLSEDQVKLADANAQIDTTGESGDQTNSGNTIMNPFVFLKNVCDREFPGVYDIKFLLTQDEMDVAEDVFDITNFKEFTDKNFFQLITDVLNSCATNDEMEMLKNQRTIAPTQKTLYNYYVSDNSEDGLTGGTIYIYKQKPYNAFNVNSKENEETGNDEQTTTEDGETKDIEVSNKVIEIKENLSMAFSWFGHSDDAYNFLVKDWNPKFDGSVLLAMAWNFQTKGEEGSPMVFRTIDKDGKVINVQSMGANRIGNDSGNVIQQTIQEFSTWGAITQYPYEAEMTTIGIPCEVPMCAIIKVIAKIYNAEHHSSGYYYVLGKEDSITSSGYFTTLRLFKIVPTYNPDSDTFKATAGEENPNPTTNASNNFNINDSTTTPPDANEDNAPTVYNNINLLAKELINAVVDSINNDDTDKRWIRYLSEDEVKALDKYLAETTVAEEEGRSKLDDALETELTKMFTTNGISTDPEKLEDNPVFMGTLPEDSQLKMYIQNHASDNRFGSNSLYYSWLQEQVDRGLLTKDEMTAKNKEYYSGR